MSNEYTDLARENQALREQNERLDAELAALRAHVDAVEKWKAEGESYFADPRKTGILFQVAVWWADRPWRVKA